MRNFESVKVEVISLSDRNPTWPLEPLLLLYEICIAWSQ